MVTLQKNARATQLNSLGAVPIKERKRTSVAIAAVVVFLIAITLLLRLERTYSRPVVSLPGDANIVFAGSSVIAVPLLNLEGESWRCHYRETHPYFHCPKTERLLENYHIDNPNVWCSAVVGQSIYQTKKCVEQNVFYFGRPRVLCLCIAPIDFISSRPVAVRRIGVPLLDNLVQYVETYKKEALDSFRLRNQNRANSILYKLYEYFKLKEPLTQRWARMERGYRSGYANPFGDERFQALSNIVSICKTRNIKVIVVSTPLAPSNRKLMSLGLYSVYTSKVRTAVGKETPIIDLGMAESFKILEPQDFDDPAHCNERGMAKIIATISKPIASLLRN